MHRLRHAEPAAPLNARYVGQTGTVSMKYLSPRDAERYRRIHMTLWIIPAIVVVLSFLLASRLPEGTNLQIAAGATGLVGLCVGLAAVTLFQRWLIRYVDPDPELRAKVQRLSWSFRPFSSFWAVGELLDQSVLRGGRTPAWVDKSEKSG